MIIYDWKIKECLCYNDMYGKKDVVFAVLIEITATNTQTNYSNKHQVSFGIPYNDDDDYVAFEDLTSDIILEWVKTYMNVEEQQRLEKLAKSNIDIISVKSL